MSRDEHARTAAMLARAAREQQVLDALRRLRPEYAPTADARERAREFLRAALADEAADAPLAC